MLIITTTLVVFSLLWGLSMRFLLKRHLDRTKFKRDYKLANDTCFKIFNHYEISNLCSDSRFACTSFSQWQFLRPFKGRKSASEQVGGNYVRSEQILENRCPQFGQNCTSFIPVTFLRPEKLPGHRLVGASRNDTYPCYPLTDADLMRSRLAVPGVALFIIMKHSQLMPNK
jgi:hypothetical protein